MCRLIICLIFVSCASIIEATIYADCGSKFGTIHSVTVIPCPSEPCQLKKKTNITVDIDFTPTEAVEKVTSVVIGIIAGLPIPFPLPNPDGCKDCGLACPLEKGADEKYSTSLMVHESYPKIKLIVKWILKDAHGNDIVCMEIPAEIVD